MNRIVREHYPAAKLPAELRIGLAPGALVRVQVEVEEHRPALPAGRTWIEDILRRKADIPVATDDAVQRIRQLRDEWND